MAGSDAGDVARLSLVLPRVEERCEILVGPGLLARLGDLVPTHAPAHRYLVISDATVAERYGQRVVESLTRTGLRADLTTFPAGEASKTPAMWTTLVERLAALGAGRDSCIVSLGGGVTGDLAGFVAASFGRGLPFVQLPTSLLAMVDASVGGKTGLDLEAGKNLVGAFHQPRLVAMDPTTLKTLPPDRLREGLAEAVKHGAIEQLAHFEWIEQHCDALLEGEVAALERLIVDSVRIKARFVAEDTRERGARAALNFGHTVGHALEHAAGYRLPHGEAVAIGMVVEARAGERFGATEAGTSERMARLLDRLGLPVAAPPELSSQAVLEAVRTDKKRVRDEPRYVLLKRIGEVARGVDGGWTQAVPDEVVRAALDAV